MGEKQRDIKDDGYKVGPGKPPREAMWKPGQSGNPKGRRKGTGGPSVTARLRKLVFEDNEGALADRLAQAATAAALRGDYRFFKEIVDRLDGPVKQQIEADMSGALKIIRESDAELLDRADKGEEPEGERNDQEGDEG